MTRSIGRRIHVAAAVGILALLLFTRDASAAVQLGVRGGYYHSSGDVLEGRRGDVGGNGLWGVAGVVSMLPTLDLEFAYERYTNNLDTNEIPTSPSKFKDGAYLLTGKLRMPIAPVTFPLWFHVGGGVGLHHLEASGGIDAASHEIITEAKNQGEWHAVVGADVKLSSFLFYGEYRYQDLTSRHGARFHSVYAGVNLYLE
jgi:opacity protein-like surface antigen